MHCFVNQERKHFTGVFPRVKPFTNATFLFKQVRLHFEQLKENNPMKKKLGNKNSLYPLPTVLVGTVIDGKPNYITMAHIGIMEPNTIAMGMGKSHFTNQGIIANQSFSVNVPTEAMVKETDHMGLVSGKKVDKSKYFSNFFGAMESAPMIEECPLNMVCELVQTVDFKTHDVFIGKVLETYCDENYLTDGIVDLGKLKPILFSMFDRSYWSLGQPLAKAWSVGKELIDS